MMIYSFGDKKVRFEGEGHFVAPNASVIGSVVLHDRSSVWFGAVIRGDNDLIEIGSNSNIQDCAVLHTDPGFHLKIEEGVTVGHHAMLHGCNIGAYSLVGINAVVLNGAKVGKHSIIGANALVPENMEIPDGYLVVGSPAKVKRPLTDVEKKFLEASAAHYAHNAEKFVELLKEQS